MDKKYLHKVIDRLVSETRIDYDEEKLYLPFTSPRLIPNLAASYIPILPPFCPDSFHKHCRNVYGLNDIEIDYVWLVYVDIIKDKLENGQ